MISDEAVQAALDKYTKLDPGSPYEDMRAAIEAAIAYDAEREDEEVMHELDERNPINLEAMQIPIMLAMRAQMTQPYRCWGTLTGRLDRHGYHVEEWTSDEGLPQGEEFTPDGLSHDPTEARAQLADRDPEAFNAGFDMARAVAEVEARDEAQGYSECSCVGSPVSRNLQDGKGLREWDPLCKVHGHDAEQMAKRSIVTITEVVSPWGTVAKTASEAALMKARRALQGDK